MVPSGLPLMRWVQRRQATEVAATASAPLQRAASTLPTTPERGSLDYEAGTGGLSDLTDEVWSRHSRDLARYRAPRPAGSQGTLLRVESAPLCRRRRGGEFQRPSDVSRPATLAEGANEGGTPRDDAARPRRSFSFDAADMLHDRSAELEDALQARRALQVMEAFQRSRPSFETEREELAPDSITGRRARQDFWDSGSRGPNTDPTAPADAHDQFLPPELALRAHWFHGHGVAEEKNIPGS